MPAIPKTNHELMHRDTTTPRLIAALAMLAMACDNPVTPGAAHEEPAGAAVFIGESEVVRSIGGEVTGALPQVAVGMETELLTVVLLDEHGDGLDLTGEEDAYLRVTIEEPTTAEWQGTGYTGRIVGKAEGTATLTFQLMHGEPPGGHADFTSMPLEVVVTP